MGRNGLVIGWQNSCFGRYHTYALSIIEDFGQGEIRHLQHAKTISGNRDGPYLDKAELNYLFNKKS